MNAPRHAVSIWLEGDRIWCQFPDRQTVHFDSTAQLLVMLKHRRDTADHRVGTDASPVQYDIDVVAETLARQKHSEEWDGRVKAAGERRRTRDEAEAAHLIRKYDKERERKEARKLMEAAGLL